MHTFKILPDNFCTTEKDVTVLTIANYMNF